MSIPGVQQVQRAGSWLMNKVGWRKGSIVVSLEPIKTGGSWNMMSNLPVVKEPAPKIPIDNNYSALMFSAGVC